MICKYCFAEVEEGATVCPVCGKELEAFAVEAQQKKTAEKVEQAPSEETPVEETPTEKKKKSGVWKKVLAITGVVLLAIILAGAILHFMGLGKQVLHTLKFWRPNDIDYKLTYTEEDKVAEKKKDTVVATVGKQTLTNGELQIYYWMEVYGFLEYCGNYLSYMGIDASKPLDDQIFDDQTGQTYQEMFLEQALKNWHESATLVELAEEAGFKLSDEKQQELDSIPTKIEELIKEYNYTDAEEFVDKELFPGCSYEIYLKYVKMSYIAESYRDALYEQLMPTQEQLEAYYTENEAKFKENKIDKSAGNYYDVRHILIGMEGSADSLGNYDAAQWQTCLDKAQTLQNEFLAGEKTEEAFAKLAMEYSIDPGSVEDGGLYSQLTKETGFIEGFKNWYMDESRQPGDTGLVKNTESTEQGYHIMYFCRSYPIWEYEGRSIYLYESAQKIIQEGQAKWPNEVNYKKIVVSTIDLTAQ